MSIFLIITATKLSDWSRGMIPALGAGGPGFDSRIGPSFYFNWKIYPSIKKKIRFFFMISLFGDCAEIGKGIYCVTAAGVTEPE